MFVHDYFESHYVAAGVVHSKIERTFKRSVIILWLKCFLVIIVCLFSS